MSVRPLCVCAACGMRRKPVTSLTWNVLGKDLAYAKFCRSCTIELFRGSVLDYNGKEKQ